MNAKILSDKPERISLSAYFELFMNLTRREVKGRYSQSLFGAGWAIAQPLATMAVFTLVFSRLAQMPSGGAPYPLFAFAALVPWFFFSNSVMSGTMSLVTYRNIVTKTYFPREIVPLAQVGSRLVDLAASSSLFVVLMIYYQAGIGPWAAMVPVFLTLLVLFTIGVTLITSAINVFYRDVNPVVQIGLQLWLYLTPVAYPLSAVPEKYRAFWLVNPLAGVVEGLRAVLVFGREPDWAVVGVSAALIAVIFVIGVVLFKSTDKYFADVISNGRTGLQAPSPKSQAPFQVSIAIQLENVTKRYRTGRSRTIVDLVASSISDLRGQTTEVHSATRGKIDATIHALRDVSFEVKEGAGLGIIGRNGAGKTTLLKMISRVTWPTSGTVRVAGHVVSLIELGAGFHPELTGRENVYLGAGLFGLTRKQIDRQFDAIVNFADVERLIDTPMKRYSSGLYARLGFSVAIHSNPDIVLVDEVLSVGDASFRRRAMEALRGLIASGKTVLFISHDMWNVRRLCSDILWMENGAVRAYGEAGAIAETYMNEVNLQAMQNQATSLQSHRGGTGEVRFDHVELFDASGVPAATFKSDDTLVIRGSYLASKPVESPVFQVAIVDIDTGVVVTTANTGQQASRPAGQQGGGPAGIVEGPGEIEFRFAHLPLRPRQYVLRLSITDAFQLASYDVVTAGPRFAITGQGAGVDSLADEQDGLVTVPFEVAHRAGRGASV